MQIRETHRWMRLFPRTRRTQNTRVFVIMCSLRSGLRQRFAKLTPVSPEQHVDMHPLTCLALAQALSLLQICPSMYITLILAELGKESGWLVKPQGVS